MKKLPELMKNKGFHKVLIVTDKGIVSLGLMNVLLTGLKAEKLEYIIYDKTVPNPTIDNIEEAFQLYKDNSCDSLIGFIIQEKPMNAAAEL